MISQRLLAVEIDNRKKVPQAMMRREHHRFPHGPFIELGVAEKDKRPTGRATQAAGQGRAGRNRQAVPERPGTEIDTRQPVFRMDAEQRVVATIGFQLLPCQRAVEEQHRVQRKGGVAL